MKTKIFELAAILLLFAGSFSSCKIKEGGEASSSEEGEINTPVYVWPQGPKYYYAFDEKIPLYEAPNKVVLSFDEKYFSEIQKYLQDNGQVQNMVLNDNHYFYILTIEKPNIKMLRKDFSEQKGVISVNPLYLIYGGTEAPVTGEVCVKFNEHVSQQEIDRLVQKYRLAVVHSNPISYTQRLIAPIDLDLLEIANAIQESGLVIYSHPNFILKHVYL